MSLSFKARIILKFLNSTRGKIIEITFPDGSVESFGNGESTIKVQAVDWKVFDELIEKGDLGMAEAIIDGRLIVDDIAGLIEWACRNEEAMDRFMHGS